MGRIDQRLNPTHEPRLLSKEPVATQRYVPDPEPLAPTPLSLLTTASTPQTKMTTQTKPYTTTHPPMPRHTPGYAIATATDPPATHPADRRASDRIPPIATNLPPPGSIDGNEPLYPQLRRSTAGVMLRMSRLAPIGGIGSVLASIGWIGYDRCRPVIRAGRYR